MLMQEEKTKAGWELRCCCRGLHSLARRECFCCLQHVFSLQNCQNRKSCFLMCFVWAQFVLCVSEVSHLVVRMRCG